MYQKDYILRLIEQMIQTLAIFFGLMKKGDLQKAEEFLDNTYYDLLKEDAAFFRSIPEENLTDELLGKHNYTNGHLEILAELFNAEAELNLAKGNKCRSLLWSRKSLRLFRFIDQSLKIYSIERINKMASIEERINNLK